MTTGYVDDSSTCLSSDPVDKNTAYGNYPTLLNGPLSSAVSCKAPVPFCVPHVQATWSAPPPPSRWLRNPMSQGAASRLRRSGGPVFVAAAMANAPTSVWQPALLRDVQARTASQSSATES